MSQVSPHHVTDVKQTLVSAGRRTESHSRLAATLRFCGQDGVANFTTPGNERRGGRSCINESLNSARYEQEECHLPRGAMEIRGRSVIPFRIASDLRLCCMWEGRGREATRRNPSVPHTLSMTQVRGVALLWGNNWVRAPRLHRSQP